MLCFLEHPYQLELLNFFLLYPLISLYQYNYCIFSIAVLMYILHCCPHQSPESGVTFVVFQSVLCLELCKRIPLCIIPECKNLPLFKYYHFLLESWYVRKIIIQVDLLLLTCLSKAVGESGTAYQGVKTELSGKRKKKMGRKHMYIF